MSFDVDPVSMTCNTTDACIAICTSKDNLFGMANKKWMPGHPTTPNQKMGNGTQLVLFVPVVKLNWVVVKQNS